MDGGAIRNTQVLMCSDNLTEWCIKDTVLTCDQPELYGFQYVDWQFDGKTLFLSPVRLGEIKPEIHPGNMMLII